MALTGKKLEEKLRKNATYLFLLDEKNYGKVLSNVNPLQARNCYIIEKLKRISDKLFEVYENANKKSAADFVKSVIEQFDKKGYVSKKQAGIVNDILVSFDMWSESDDKNIEKIKEKEMISLYEDFKDEIDSYIPRAKREYEEYCANYAASFKRGPKPWTRFYC